MSCQNFTQIKKNLDRADVIIAGALLKMNQIWKSVSCVLVNQIMRAAIALTSQVNSL